MKKTSDDCAPGEKAAVPPESSRTARSCVPVPKIEEDCYDWWARHEEKCRTACSFRAEVVFLGDSLTHFWSGESGPDYGEGLWNELYGDLPVLNLGFGFDRTQNVLWRMAHGARGTRKTVAVAFRRQYRDESVFHHASLQRRYAGRSCARDCMRGGGASQESAGCACPADGVVPAREQGQRDPGNQPDSACRASGDAVCGMGGSRRDFRR